MCSRTAVVTGVNPAQTFKQTLAASLQLFQHTLNYYLKNMHGVAHINQYHVIFLNLKRAKIQSVTVNIMWNDGKLLASTS